MPPLVFSALSLSLSLLSSAWAAPAGGQGPSRFIVTVEAAHPAAVAADHGIAPDHVYDVVVNGFAAPMSELARQGLMRDHRVVRVERDAEVTTSSPAGTWGLDRIDQRSKSLDGLYLYDRTGAGVTAYVVDTGIRVSHTDFGGRAWAAFDAFGGNGIDCHGHGTHVAGTIGGATWGVARGASLASVRVLDCNGYGSISGVIAGLDWIAKNAPRPAVVNLSLSASASDTFDAAVERLAGVGILPVVAAANYGLDACNYSPGRAASAFTVGASDPDDKRASFSNWGACVDLFAPGTSIVSAGHASNTATATMSGTSMAAPHAAGVAALVLEASPAASVASVAEALVQGATQHVVTNSHTPKNHVLYSRIVPPAEDPAEPAPPPRGPTADFDVACTGAECAFSDRSVRGDASIGSWTWSFGDGTGSTLQDPDHTYASSGTWTVYLTVTDDLGLGDTVSRQVPVTAPTTGFELRVTPGKVRGQHQGELAWSGAAGAQVDVWRDGVRVDRTANDGQHVDFIGTRGKATYSYRLCEAGTSTCSPERVVDFN